jgi:outer membrane protein assembly factor BamD
MKKSFVKFILIFLVIPTLVACWGEKKEARTANNADAELKRCLSISAKKKQNEVIDCLDVFKSRYPSEEAAADAELMIADSYFRKKEYLLAAGAYQEFIEKYPYHQKIDYAYYQSGVSYLNDSPKAVDRDQKNLDLAIKNFEILGQYFPESTYGKMAPRMFLKTKMKMAHHDYYVGRFYYKYNEYLAAIPRFATIVNEYPKLGYDEQSFYYLIHCLIKTNQKEKAQEAISLFQERYPGSNLLKKAKGQIKG